VFPPIFYLIVVVSNRFTDDQQPQCLMQRKAGFRNRSRHKNYAPKTNRPSAGGKEAESCKFSFYRVTVRRFFLKTGDFVQLLQVKIFTTFVAR